MKKFLAVTLLCVMVIVAFSSCAASTDIKIGVFEPKTGSDEESGKLELEGIKLAHDLYGEVLDKKIKLVEKDTSSTSADAKRVVTELLEKNYPVAMIGTWGSTRAAAVNETIKEGKIPTMSASNSNPDVNAKNEWYFRACLTDAAQSEHIADFINSKVEDGGLGVESTAILMDKSSKYANNILTEFKQWAGKNVGNATKAVPIQKSYEAGQGNRKDVPADFTEELSAVLEDGSIGALLLLPDPTMPDVLAQMIGDARTLGISIPIVIPEMGESQDFFDALAELKIDDIELGDIYIVSFFDVKHEFTPETKKFLDACKNSNKYTAEQLTIVAQGYDAYIILRKAIEMSEDTSPEKIRAALNEMKNFEGATGLISEFDSSGNAKKPVLIKKYEKGNFVTLREVGKKTVATE